MRPELKKPDPQKIRGNRVLDRREQQHMQSSSGQNKISLLKNSEKPVCLEWSKPGGLKMRSEKTIQGLGEER